MTSLAEAVGKADRQRFLSTLYAPAELRDALLSLYAFNVELARIRDLVNEPMAGEMRLQWWCDAIAGDTATETAGHPVVASLRQTIHDYQLPLNAFDNMIEARRFDLYNDPMPSRNDLEGYCGETASSLIQLSSNILAPHLAKNHAGAAGHAGCAQAIAGLLSLLPLHRHRGQCFFPADMLAAVGATREDVIGRQPGPPARQAINAMIALGRDHLVRFERLAPDIPDVLRPAFLPLSGVRAWFSMLERAGDTVFERSIKPSPLRLSAATLRRAGFGWR